MNKSGGIYIDLDSIQDSSLENPKGTIITYGDLEDLDDPKNP